MIIIYGKSADLADNPYHQSQHGERTGRLKSNLIKLQYGSYCNRV